MPRLVIAALSAALVLTGCASGADQAAVPGDGASPVARQAARKAATSTPAPASRPADSPAATPAAPPARSGPAVAVKRVTVRGTEVSLLVMNPDKARFRFVPGTESPGGYSSSTDAPSTYRRSMLAAFNGAFLPRHTQGGYWFRGRSYDKLVEGRASLVIDNDGHLDVVKWDGSDPGRFAVVRQNIRLLIDDGVDETRGRNGCDDWGELGTGPQAHRRCPGERSALGVTADGTVIYAFGFEVMAGDLASVLAREGAVRAMTLDINNWWPSAFTYLGGKGKRVDPQVRDEPTRYNSSTPWKRDFVVVLPR